MTKTNLIAIDVAKNVFQLCELDDRMKVHSNEQVRRDRLKQTLAKRSPCIVAMEACYSSHYWAREFAAMGHDVRLIPAQHVKPFVRGNKNDANDALAIAEASQRPNLRFVPMKSLEQQDMQALHRIRIRLVGYVPSSGVTLGLRLDPMPPRVRWRRAVNGQKELTHLRT